MEALRLQDAGEGEGVGQRDHTPAASALPLTGTNQLALWVPEEDLEGSAGAFVHRTLDPVYKPGGGTGRASGTQEGTGRASGTQGYEGYDWEAIAAGEQAAVEIPEGERAWFSARYTLRGLYEHPVYGLNAIRAARVRDATLAAGSRAKDRQALNRWERYSRKPGDWPAGVPWQGRPLVACTDEEATATCTAMRRALAWTTCRSTWNHLRIIFRRAVDVKAIKRVPVVTWGRTAGTERAPKELYNDRQIGDIWRALAGQTDLQVAFCLSVNVGLRTVDLFCLRWEDLQLSRDRPVVEFTARKTGKRQVVPLGPVTVAQLERWRRKQGILFPECGGLVWPELTDASAPDPERSRAARERNRRFKAALESIGIRHKKPWQVGRLTCNERLESHRPGSGQFVLGHSATLNSTSYREPSGMVYEAVVTLAQPECFGGSHGG